MAYVVYDLQDSPTYDGQAGLDRCDVAALAAAAQGQGVVTVTGCAVSQHTGSDYYVNVATATTFGDSPDNAAYTQPAGNQGSPARLMVRAFRAYAS